ncbi:unnamed protein product [Toxocara canis]|uniref:MRP-S28 domain-containing protein n=1 Tax=Toxocara canis TaxID=6265 RepID=A0A183V5W7_TOXCA|nr:unnamed protein product [Toxocara canis]
MSDALESLPHRNEQASVQKVTELSDTGSASVAETEIANASLGNSNIQYLCGTDITLQWLHRKLMEALGADEPLPHWIAERVDTPSHNKVQRSKVLKVTFGWENARMPASVILKMPMRVQDEESGAVDEEQNRLINSMFKRRKHSTESSCGVIVMEDLGENGQRGNMKDGLTVDSAKDLLRNLAIIHAKSILSGRTLRF